MHTVAFVREWRRQFETSCGKDKKVFCCPLGREVLPHSRHDKRPSLLLFWTQTCEDTVSILYCSHPPPSFQVQRSSQPLSPGSFVSAPTSLPSSCGAGSEDVIKTTPWLITTIILSLLSPILFLCRGIVAPFGALARPHWPSSQLWLNHPSNHTLVHPGIIPHQTVRF